MKKKFLSSALAVLTVFAVLSLEPVNFHAQNAGTGNISPLNGGLPAPLIKNVSGRSTKDGATTTASLIAAQGAGIKTYITGAQCVNSSASTVTVANILDGSTVLWSISCPAAGANSPMVFFNPPLVGTANTAVGMAVTIAVTTAYLSVEGYTSK